MMRSRILLLAGFALAPVSVPAQSAASHIAVGVYGDTTVHLSLGRLRKIVDLSGAALSPALATARVLFDVEKNGRRYLVLDVSGPTIPRGGAGECGAGTESSLVWMEMSDKLSPLRVEAAVYESCRNDAEGVLADTSRGVRTEFRYVEEYSDGGKPKAEWIHCLAGYDSAHPEKGLDVRREVADPQP